MLPLGKRISYAFRCFFGVLGGGTIPDDVARDVVELPPAPAAPAPAPQAPAPVAPVAKPAAPLEESSDRAFQMLAILQRDGRLVDFLTEDIAAYSDDQVGAAVRSVHESCRQALERYMVLEPILTSEEGSTVTLPSVDPASVKVIGNVASGAAARGILRHRGWRVASSSLPPLAQGGGRDVLAPAEIEVS